jgi:hypothetical protein
MSDCGIILLVIGVLIIIFVAGYFFGRSSE